MAKDPRRVRREPVHSELAARVVDCCRALARFSEEPESTTRTFLSEPMRDVHATLTSWMTRAGMSTRVDGAGNLRGVYAAADPGPAESTRSVPTLLIGSHLDTVPRAGAFDGVLGVVIGIALVEALHGARLTYAIEVVGFSEEEGVRFGVPFIGSRAVAGTLDDDLLERRDAHGRCVAGAISAFGLNPADIPAARAQGPFLGYLEFHIEQGPVLDGLGVPLGIVEAIAGQTRADVVFTGGAGHAGTTPMSHRRDALAAAAEWIAIVEHEAQQRPGLVATVGHVSVEPGAANVIPGRCWATLDVRHADDEARKAAATRLAGAAHEIGSRRAVDVTWTSRLDQPAVAMHAAQIAVLQRAVLRAGVPVCRLVSGAGHDAMIMAPLMPTAMLFLRSPGGLSHHPDEAVREDDVAAALLAGLHVLDELGTVRLWS
ncbi:MAG: allantoate amidohydrolase [Acidobacteria bacterium]|nr:allantoate amidohydrolase [Acidobacteriota bacterium]